MATVTTGIRTAITDGRLCYMEGVHAGSVCSLYAQLRADAIGH